MDSIIILAILGAIGLVIGAISVILLLLFKDILFPYFFAWMSKKVLAVIFTNKKTIKFAVADMSKYVITVDKKAYLWTQESIWHIGSVPVVILFEPYPSSIDLATIRTLEYFYYKDPGAFSEFINELFKDSNKDYTKIDLEMAEDLMKKLAKKLNIKNPKQVLAGFSVSPEAVFRYLFTGIRANDVLSAIMIETSRRAEEYLHPWRLDIIIPAASFALLAVAVLALGFHIYDNSMNKLPQCQNALADCQAKLSVAEQVCNLPWEENDLNTYADVNKKTPPMRGGSHPVR